MKLNRIIISIMCVCSALYAGTPGDKGGQVLKMGVDARITSMGEAGCAISGDANSIYWNPANLTDITGQEMSFSHMTKIQGIRFANMSYAKRSGTGVLGAGLFMLYTEDTRRDNLGNDQGSFTDYNSFFILSYADKLSGNLDAGLSLKLISNKLDEYKSGNIAFDAGTRYKKGIFAVGLSLQNIGTEVSVSGDKETLPLNLKAGAAVYLPYRIVLACDADVPNDSEPVYHVGAEYGVVQALKLRVGYKYYSEDNKLDGPVGLNAGFGMKFGRYTLDYGYAPMGDLGKNVHRMTVDLSF